MSAGERVPGPLMSDVTLWPEAGPLPGLLVRLGRVDYQVAWQLQATLAAERRAGALPDLLLLLEHPPTFTIGRSGKPEHLLAGPEELARLGATVVPVDRGGDITFHGPGQLVGYPIIDLYQRGRDVHRYLRLLEETIIRTLADLGLAVGRLAPHTGVWSDDEKLAAIGVRVSRGVTTHGFALNIDVEQHYFQAIVPCGIRDKGVTSLAARLAELPEREVVERLIAGHFAMLAGLRWHWLDLRADRPQAAAATILGLAARLGLQSNPAPRDDPTTDGGQTVAGASR